MEDSSAFATKEILGYMWPLPLLKKHEKAIPKRLQSITHQGKCVKGAILSEWALGDLSLFSSFLFTSVFTQRRMSIHHIQLKTIQNLSHIYMLYKYLI